jgi:hypothetical protein
LLRWNISLEDLKFANPSLFWQPDSGYTARGFASLNYVSGSGRPVYYYLVIFVAMKKYVVK